MYCCGTKNYFTFLQNNIIHHTQPYLCMYRIYNNWKRNFILQCSPTKQIPVFCNFFSLGQKTYYVVIKVGLFLIIVDSTFYYGIYEYNTFILNKY